MIILKYHQQKKNGKFSQKKYPKEYQEEWDDLKKELSQEEFEELYKQVLPTKKEIKRWEEMKKSNINDHVHFKEKKESKESKNNNLKIAKKKKKRVLIVQ